jgi:hypothetical protein
MAGSAAYQRVDRSYSLIAQNEGSVTDQTEKAFVFSAETEISWCPFPTEAGAPVGTRLPGALRNILNSDRNFKPLPTDRKRGPEPARCRSTAGRFQALEPWDTLLQFPSRLLCDAGCEPLALEPAAAPAASLLAETGQAMPAGGSPRYPQAPHHLQDLGFRILQRAQACAGHLPWIRAKLVLGQDPR